jgi:hypothetical protein
MKVLCSQEVVSAYRCGSYPGRALRRRLHLRHHGICPGSWLPKGYQAGRVKSKPFDFYAFSWGAPRKPARNLAETAQRKSQDTSRLPLSTCNAFRGCRMIEFPTSLCCCPSCRSGVSSFAIWVTGSVTLVSVRMSFRSGIRAGKDSLLSLVNPTKTCF